MKKTLIHIFKTKFTEYDYFYRGYGDLEKKYNIKVIINDLSSIFFPRNNPVKAKGFKNSIKFDSIKEWSKYLGKYKKRKNVFLVNDAGADTFLSLILNYYIKKLKLPVVIDMTIGVVNNNNINDINFQYKIFYRIIRFLKNPYRIIFFFKKKILAILFFFIKFKKIIILKDHKNFFNLPYRSVNKKIIQINSKDYSLFLNYKKKNNIKKKPIVFIDNTFPYYTYDQQIHFKQKNNLDIKKWYNEHNIFFEKLENFFSTKVIVVPHPRAKGINNPYLKKRIIDHRMDALLNLTSSSLFFLCGLYVSTAISYPILSYKPIFFMYSDQMKSYDYIQVEEQKKAAKLIGSGIININKFSKKEFQKRMRVSKILYDRYKYQYLTSKKLLNMSNNKIISTLF